MEEALSLAREAGARGEVPVGAVVVHGDRVLAGASNRREADQDPTAHAELLAIRAAAAVMGSWRLEGCTLYVTLEPCAMCAGAMVLARVERCVFGAADPKGGFLGSVGDLSAIPALNHRFEVIGGVEADASAELLSAFFRDIRARNA
ncbi:MAG: nucleoside deaminase [Deltaproteobacteria bacterium]|nr:nucleoside deaminase [Deltaproteobacteria bacterium]